MTKPASLNDGAISFAAKGQGQGSIPPTPLTGDRRAQVEEEAAPAKPRKPAAQAATAAPKTLSWKADADRYKRLRRAVVETDHTGQDIITEAMDAWFKKNGF